jgi:Tol biopolymer transport system component
MLVWQVPLLAQSVRIVSPPRRLALPFASAAKISPTGQFISFTGKSFNKLFISDADGLKVRELCSHDGAGWGHQWSSDGRFIAVRSNHADGKTKLVSLELLDVVTGAETAVTGLLPSRNRLSLPQWNGPHLMTFTTRAGLETRKIELRDSSATILPLTKQEAFFSRWATEVLEISSGTRINRVRPFRQLRQVINSSWSTDGSLSAVEFGGRPSLYVFSADGKSQLLIDAKGESPGWFRNEFIVYMIIDDDGYRILSGNIWISDSTGKEKKNLTEGFGEIALNPSVAADGTILFTTEDGAIYKMRITLE